MSNIVEVRHTLSAVELRAHKNTIAEVVRSVMQPEVHYGKIPGTDKPTLYQAGADCLLATFHIAPSFRVEDLGGDGISRYRVTCIGTHQGTGIVMGEGVGECSSGEDKYKWRRALCDEEFDATPETHRRVKFAKGRGGSVYKNQQIRTDPADFANTALKMAAKRAKVAMTLNVLAASDFFTQDVEDLPEGALDREDAHGGIQAEAPEMPEGLLEEAQAKALEGMAALQAWFEGIGKEKRRPLAPHLDSLKKAAAAADKPADAQQQEAA